MHLPGFTPVNNFGVHKNEARNGIKLDLIGENDAMKNYSSGQTPSISRHISKNVFFTDAEIFSYQSFARSVFWNTPIPQLKDHATIEGNDLNHKVEL
ncbi:hypothetical protein [Legionella cardiaca]|uniref:Uncharacterized protein n=1 Tax=Legionella cardiaca TaxID=1071983 RepID=A0ABY8ANU4_9GAMM|nr:hypothetical protein [Legionella cardiaca]WED42364.1 hypothetical protein PXX05_10590 [Legionella cardiaca]